MHKITIPQTVTIEYDGTETQFIGNANDLSLQEAGEGLDTMDAGDATGFFLSLLLLGHDEDDPIRFKDGTTVHFTITTELFRHEGDW